nr:GreA/GreB family elongation factor [Vibrio sonorensis]
MNKAELLNAVVELAEQNLSIAKAATQTAMDAATDEQTKPEHKYDTLALEAAYLAHGQAMRVEECEQELAQLKALPEQSFVGRSAGVGAYIVLEDEQGKSRHLLLCPCSGGTVVTLAGVEISVVTPSSPIGRAVMGKQVDDEISLQVGDAEFCYELANLE